MCNNLFEDHFIIATSVKNTQLKHVLCSLLTTQMTSMLNVYIVFKHFIIYPLHMNLLSKSVSINISTLFTRAPLYLMDTKKIILYL